MFKFNINDQVKCKYQGELTKGKIHLLRYEKGALGSRTTYTILVPLGIGCGSTEVLVEESELVEMQLL